MRWLSAALACVTLLTTTPATAFVTPRFSSARDRGRRALLGTWRSVTYKSSSGPPVLEAGITVTFDRTTLRVDVNGKVERGTWRVIDQDGDIVELEVLDDKGKKHDVDVLIESNTALTLYIDDGDDEEVLRVERID